MLQFIALHISIFYGVLFEGCGRSTGSVGTIMRSTSSVRLLFSHEERTVACLLGIQTTLNVYHGESNVRACHFVASLHPASPFPKALTIFITRWYMYSLQVFRRPETDHLLEVRAFCVLMKPFSETIRKIKTLGHTAHSAYWPGNHSVSRLPQLDIDILPTTLSPRTWNHRSKMLVNGDSQFGRLRCLHHYHLLVLHSAD